MLSFPQSIPSSSRDNSLRAWFTKNARLHLSNLWSFFFPMERLVCEMHCEEGPTVCRSLPLVFMVLFNWLLHWLVKILMVVYKSDLYQFALFAKTLHEYDEGHMLTCNQNHVDS